MDEIAAPADPSTEHGLPSCDGCRLRKLKCSRDKPACAKCRSLGVSCVYDLRKNKPGLKAGAVEGLGRRIVAVDALERIVLEHEQQPATFGPTQDLQDDAPSTQMSDSLAPVHTSLSALAREISKLSENISILSQSTTSSFVRSSHGKSQASNEARPNKRPRFEPGPHQEHPNLNNNNNVTDLEEQSSLESDLLSGDRLEALLDAYFNNLHPWIPMIHTATFRQKMRTQEASDGKSVILRAILAGTLHLVNPEPLGLTATQVRQERERARNRVVVDATNGLSVENLQALIIVAFTDIGNGDSSRAWSIVGSLTRTVEYLHLSVEDQDVEAPMSYLSPSPLSPPKSWLEEEERRRVFWNVFVLDRYVCSQDFRSGASTDFQKHLLDNNWVGLTADNVWRRLPVCGTHWNDEVKAQSPFFELWDKSAAKISNSIAFLPAHYPSPERSAEMSSLDSNHSAAAAQRAHQASGPIDMSTVGAFAYYVESLESLCRINIYFLQQKVNFDNPDEVSNWLTRFKELDLRLVHWKMFLPPKWKDPSVPPPETASFLDPNMSLAHVTHNTSMILLHQRIGYPGHELRKLKLPSYYSAETCLSAAVETANITREYLASASPAMPISPHFGFCAFVSAKVLLVHWRYYGVDLDIRFQVLVDCIREISRRWQGNQNPRSTLAGKFERELVMLWDRCREDPDFHVKVLSPLSSTHYTTSSQDKEDRSRGSQDPFASNHFVNGYDVPRQQQAEHCSTTVVSANQPGFSPYYSTAAGRIAGSNTIGIGEQNDPRVAEGDVAGWIPPANGGAISLPAASDNGINGHDGLSNILQALADSSFMQLDRVISFEDNYSPIATQVVEVDATEGHGWTAPSYG